MDDGEGLNTPTTTATFGAGAVGQQGRSTTTMTSVFNSYISSGYSASGMTEEIKSVKKSLEEIEVDKLAYEIHRYSSFSTNYVPE